MYNLKISSFLVHPQKRKGMSGTISFVACRRVEIRSVGFCFFCEFTKGVTMSRKIRHTRRCLSSAQWAFILSRIGPGGVLERDIPKLSLLFKKRFGVQIHPRVIRRLISKRKNDSKKVIEVRQTIRRSYRVRYIRQ